MMAGDWIKIETTTPDKPEVFRIAEALGNMDPDAVMGKLLRVWIWADQQTTNGNAPSVTKTLLDRVTCAPGFAQALLEVGWLTEEKGTLTFVNFDRHNGKTAKSRALTLKRVRQVRNGSVTQAALPRDRERVLENTKRSSSKRRPKVDPAFAKAFYDAFPPKRRAKQAKVEETFATAVASLRAGGMAEPEKYLIQRAVEYAASPVGQGDYVQGPCPWLNGGCWNDAPEAWGLSGATNDPPLHQKSRAAQEAEEVERVRKLKQQATQEAS